jgi:single-strand DNA-binding protein
MTDLNHIILTGNITHDIGERDKQKVGETTKLKVTIAVNRSQKVNGEYKNVAFFFDVEVWGKLADNLEKYLVKGKSIAVDGYLKQDRWEKDGQKQSRICIVAETLKLLGGKSDGESPRADAQKTDAEGFPEDPVF